ncbi:MAG: lysostaphin resistance A-like protein [Candidatus Hodarchaeales archaeon]
MLLDSNDVPRIRIIYPGITVLSVISFFTFWEIFFIDLVLELSRTLVLYEALLISISGQVLCIAFLFFLIPRLELRPFFEDYDDISDKNVNLWWVKIVVAGYLVSFSLAALLVPVIDLIIGTSSSLSFQSLINHFKQFSDLSPGPGSNFLLSISLLPIILCFIAPIFDELLFRRILIPLLSERQLKNLTPIIISSIIYACMKSITLAGELVPISYMITSFVIYFISGVFFSSVFVRTKKLSLAIISHVLWNLFVTIILMESYFAFDSTSILHSITQGLFILFIIGGLLLSIYLILDIAFHSKTNELLQSLLTLFTFSAITNLVLTLIICIFLFHAYLTRNYLLLLLVASIGLNLILFFYGSGETDKLLVPEPREVTRVEVKPRKTISNEKPRKVVTGTEKKPDLGSRLELNLKKEIIDEQIASDEPYAEDSIISKIMEQKKPVKGKKEKESDEDDPLSWY